MTRIYGIDSRDGTLSPCKAKPENRGRGACHHSAHRVLTHQEAKPAVIRAYNEAQLAKNYGATPPPQLKEKEEAPLTWQELDESVQEVAQVWPRKDWDYLNQLSYSLLQRVREKELPEKPDGSEESLQSYLESNRKNSRKLRAFLGEAVSPQHLAQLLVRNVSAMTTPSTWSNRAPRTPPRRVILTTFHNDMTRQRYIASVLFFGGRCCYCNCPLTKEAGPQKATGEHLTPISPERKDAPLGSTRYGNMALACLSCNTSRGNKDLQEWVATTPRLAAPGQREACLKRIDAFRQYTLYEEYSQEQCARIQDAITTMDNFIAEKPRDKHHHYTDRDNQAILDRFKIVLQDLTEIVRE